MSQKTTKINENKRYYWGRNGSLIWRGEGGKNNWNSYNYNILHINLKVLENE